MVIRVFFDLDGVIADTPKSLKQLGLPAPADYCFSNYYDKDREYVLSLFQDKSFIYSLEPRKDVVNVIRFLNSAGMFGGIITSRDIKLKEVTISWLNKHLGFTDFLLLFSSKKDWFFKNYVNNHKDYLVYMVEDSLENASVISRMGVRVFLYDCTYNQGGCNENIYRIYSMNDIFSFILSDIEKMFL